MKKRLLRFAAIALSVMMIVSLAGCGSKGKSSSGGGDADKTITFWNIGAEGVNKVLLSYPVELFNEQSDSGYEVEFVATQNDSYKEKLVVAMSSGECPDMYTSWSGGPMNEYIESGFAQPLDDLYEKYGLTDRLMEAGIAQSTYDGKIYAVPTYNISVAGTYYNKEMFEKYGLEVPKTISELEAVCAKLKENGITPFALANSTKWTGSMYFQLLAARYGGLEPFQAAVDGSGSFEDESFVYAGEKIQEWVEKGWFPEGVNSLSEDDGQGRQLLYQDKAAMDLIGSWYTGTLKSDSEEFYEKVGWFPFPAVDGKEDNLPIALGTVGDQFISFNCEGDKLDAAFELATYFSSEEAKAKDIENGYLPPTPDVATLVDDPISQQVLSTIADATAVQLWYDQYLPPAVADAHLNTCQELFGLTTTPEKANEVLQAAMQEYLDEK
ncbi:MAG: extracellular solute-binding protein [Clostridiales Family XIII bacterium]|jgi:raffinose/stachyose/melibiose transport system substrate-binding protein|nr:extracellular solute-binding protein [Clostridiales Family XIII bacterium]